ncbi:hypothetical protein C7U55_06590 [Faecalibacillus faecis]|uniref:Uncharacterized protein n=1 Tax=Faecalibacillus faecis TaxID=1982628 RepID=A0A2T3FZ91_9FIRM|nr:hypothetical protein C7U55_06590 [Faecalibacillus faecis]
MFIKNRHFSEIWGQNWRQITLMCILNVGKEADCEMKQLKESEDN